MFPNDLSSIPSLLHLQHHLCRLRRSVVAEVYHQYIPTPSKHLVIPPRISSVNNTSSTTTYPIVHHAGVCAPSGTNSDSLLHQHVYYLTLAHHCTTIDSGGLPTLATASSPHPSSHVVSCNFWVVCSRHRNKYAKLLSTNIIIMVSHTYRFIQPIFTQSVNCKTHHVKCTTVGGCSA